MYRRILRRTLALPLRVRALVAILVALAVGAGLVASAGSALADGYSTPISVSTTGACIDTGSGGGAWLAPCNGSNTQNWQIEPTPWAAGPQVYLLQNAGTGACLAMTGTPPDGQTTAVSTAPCGDPNLALEEQWWGQGVFGFLKFQSFGGNFLTDNGQGGLVASAHWSDPGAPATWIVNVHG
ncbi:hypothetical protein SAMN05892883_4202 [Jatrophihabitans sp. GAS493]|uniref:hypothetical protein n=1 Tax=Jatrophihabitans sp. GAS493 TaxID=1907575 RepID=UPI000BC05542|nr:hypothetical protein [Jatrophihabitans sp. GAS493]SOD75003.1 hypothetical protein SAMN05892883_4202 [Jatrophihabitans sp. GAS493]